MKLLHLDSSIQGAESASRAISAAIVGRFRDADPGIDVAYRDLVADPIAHLTLDALATPQGQAVLDEFLAADVVVIGAALYNFTIASQLKSWLDRILVAGKTFRYGESGPVGLAGGKRVIVAVARGANYAAGSPLASWEHAETLLKLALGFIGIADAEFIVAEGLALGEEARKASTDAAIRRALEIAPAPPAA